MKIPLGLNIDIATERYNVNKAKALKNEMASRNVVQHVGPHAVQGGADSLFSPGSSIPIGEINGYVEKGYPRAPTLSSWASKIDPKVLKPPLNDERDLIQNGFSEGKLKQNRRMYNEKI